MTTQKEQPMDSEVLIRLLQERHAQDVFVSECKTGPTQGANSCPRLDGWAMIKSWTNARVIGYEVKVSRSDFLRDNKWQNYLYYCNEFYFVAPKGLIKPDEIPPDAGLIEASTNFKRLLTKKAAPFRAVEIPDSIFRYILMARTKIVSPNHYEKKGADYWRNWLLQCKADKTIGKEIGYLIGKKRKEVEYENDHLKRQATTFEKQRAEINEVLNEFGITNPREYSMGRDLRAKLNAIESLKRGEFSEALGRLNREFENMKQLIAMTEQKGATDGTV